MAIDARWIERIEDDFRTLRVEMKADMAQLGVQLGSVQSQLTRLEVNLPLTYITRADFADRLKVVTDDWDRRDRSNREYTQRLETTVTRLEGLIQRLIFVILGALITGGLALLSEVFRLLGHTP